MKKTIVYSKYCRIHIGGGETLVQRMFRWCQDNGWSRFVIIFPKVKGSWVRNPLFLKAIREQGIPVEVYEDDFEKISGVPRQILTEGKSKKKLEFSNEEVTWFSDTPFCCLKGQYIAKQFPKAKYRNILYLTHPDVLKVEIGEYNVFSKVFDRLCLRKLEKNCLINMVTSAMQASEEYYQRNISAPVIPLGKDFKKFSEEKVRERWQNRERFTLLTVSRLELDFKGYLLPMLKAFESLTQRYNNIYLKIIGSGSEGDEKRFKKAINSLSKACQERIEWLPHMPYQELEQHFDSAHIYYGVGTTVLDAINESLPTIVADSKNKNVAKTDGLFSESRKIDGFGTGNIPLDEIVSTLFNMNLEEYMDCARVDYETSRSIYDMDCVMGEFMSRSIEDKRVFSKSEIQIIYRLLQAKRWYDEKKNIVRRMIECK